MGWLTEEELAVYSGEFARTGFQGGLQWYRCRTSGRFEAELELFSSRTIDVPSLFISGSSDWGVHQAPGVLERMQAVATTQMRGCHLVDGAGHWVQQEQPEAVTRLLLSFWMKRHSPPEIDPPGYRIMSNRTATKRAVPAKHPAGRSAETRLAEVRRRLAEVSTTSTTPARYSAGTGDLHAARRRQRARQGATLSRLAHEKMIDPGASVACSTAWPSMPRACPAIPTMRR